MGAEYIAGTQTTLLIVTGSMEKASVRLSEVQLGKASWASGIGVVFVGVKWGGQGRRWGGCHKQSTCRYESSWCVFRAHGEKLLVPKVKVGKRTG